MMRITVLLLFVLVGISWSQTLHQPVCHGAGGLPDWSVKLSKSHNVRFTIDASLVDTCTEYYDLEFVAELLNSHGNRIATRRFAVPNVTINGPTLRSFDFPYASQDATSVRGLMLRCKKRKLGGLPAPPKRDDPVIEQGQILRQSFETDKKSYDKWLTVDDLDCDYFEIYILGSDQMVCRSGSVEQTARQGDSAGCANVKHAAEELSRKRYEQFGDPILPLPEK